MLEVRFVEATREAGRELGVQWNVFGNNYLANIGNRTPAAQLPVTNTGGGLFSQPGVTVGGPNVPSGVTISPIAVAGVLSGTAPFGVMVGKMIKGGLDIDVIINALEQKGVARSLAEPNLVALSGDTASFLAGGEYPIPVPGGPQGQVTIDYKRFGVGLAFTPTVLSDGLINMKIEPEVSQLDFSRSLVLQGASVPSLIVRRASTTVELRDGQSFVIGGLLQSVGANTLSQLPWLGDVPMLGALFRSAQYQKSETDLAIIVTPRLVRPARPGRRHQDAARLIAAGQRRRPVPDGQDRSHAGHGSADRRRPAARIHRPYARSAEGRDPCGFGTQLRRSLTVVSLLGVTLGGCTDLYYDRRDTMSLVSGEVDGRQSRDAHDRSVVARERQAQHRLQRREGASRLRTLPHRARDPAGELHHELGRLCPVVASTGADPVQRVAGVERQLDQVARRRRRTQVLTDANDQVLRRGEQDRRGGADHGFRVRAVRAIDLRDQRADRSAGRHRRDFGRR